MHVRDVFTGKTHKILSHFAVLRPEPTPSR